METGRWEGVEGTSKGEESAISAALRRGLKNRAIEQSSEGGKPIGRTSFLSAAGLAGGQIALHSNYTTLRARWSESLPSFCVPQARGIPTRPSKIP